MINKLKTQNAKNFLSVTAVFLIFALLFSSLAMLASAAPEVNADSEATAVATESPSNPAMPMPDDEKMPAAVAEKYGYPQPNDANLDEKMKEALTTVKKVLDIDDKIYTNFNYNYYPGDEYNYNTGSWYFYWYSNDGRANINVQVMENGKILYYNKYSYSENYYVKYVKLAEVSKAAAKSKADAFLKKLLGDEFDGYRLYNQNLYYPSDRYDISYVLTKNGYDYPNFQLYISVDKMTGDIVGFNRNTYPYFETGNNNINYQNASKVISQEKALESYLENFGLNLSYVNYYDWDAKEYKIYPAYSLNYKYNEYISAVDGSLIQVGDYYGPVGLSYGAGVAENMAYDTKAQRAEAEDGGVYFSEAELLEMAKAKDFITADKAIEIMIEAFDLELGDLSGFQKGTYLQNDYILKDKYFWSISLYKQTETMYEGYSAYIDAKTGTIQTYSGYSKPMYGYYDSNGDGRADGILDKNGNPVPVYKYDEAKKIVTEKVKELFPYDMDEELVFVENEIDPSNYWYSFNFVRQVNGINVDGNGVYINFDNMTGKISYYNFSWIENVEFPKLDDIVSEEEALKSIADFCGYNIYYMTDGATEDGKINAVLIYTFDGSIMVDPFTGKCINWDSSEAEKYDNSIPDYKDLGGHWSEKIVKTLADNGIYVWGGDKFEPDKAITKGEFINYIRFIIYNYYYFNELNMGLTFNPYSLYNNDTLNTDLDINLTKQEAAKLICEISGYGEIGKHYEIFQYPFTDDKCDKEYQGYVAILKVLGLVLGDGAGNFNGTDTLTRAGAASMVYNIIMTFNK